MQRSRELHRTTKRNDSSDSSFHKVRDVIVKNIENNTGAKKEFFQKELKKIDRIISKYFQPRGSSVPTQRSMAVTTRPRSSLRRYGRSPRR